MKRGGKHHLNIGTSKKNELLKPYGFCCNIKDDDPKARPKRSISGPRFLSKDITCGGPDIKFRLQEDNNTSFSQRSVQKNSQRLGYRSELRLGHRSSYWGRQRGGYDSGQRNGGDEALICTRCKGPLKWYLEDEIATARDIMMTERQDNNHAETKRNIKIAKKKEKKKRPKKEEDTVED